MEFGNMAALLTPRAWDFDDTPGSGIATRRRSGPIAAMRRSLLMLVAVSALALMLAGTMTSAEARPWNAGAAYANSLIGACFDTGGDPFVLDMSGAYGVGCIYEDVILWDVVDHD